MYRLSVPSKTFLVGEYVALKGGPALVLNTNPRFALTAVESSIGSYHNTSTSSGVLGDIVPRMGLGRYRLEFTDPHRGRGGFGASGAEVLLLAALKELVSGTFDDADPFELLESVESIKKQIGWALGSGYDVLAMNLGMISHIERKKEQLEVLGWPFDNLGWVLLRGSQKIPTHEHLAQLKVPEFSDLSEASAFTIQALKKENEMEFLEGIIFFAKSLKDLNLVHKSIIDQLEDISRIDGIVAAKGCGALGVDTQIVIYRKEKEESVLNSLSKTYDVMESYLAPGLKVMKSI